MCKELCAAGLTKPTVRFKMSKEDRAKLPGKESTKLKSEMTPEEYKEHRIFRNAYEQARRDFFDKLDDNEYAAYQAEYHIRYNINHYEELIKPYQKTYLRKNPEYGRTVERRRRARKNNLPTDNYTTESILAFWGTACYLCGEEIDLDAPRSAKWGGNWQRGLHLDHVIPVNQGGPDTTENVKPTHALCNLRRPKGKYVRDKNTLDKLTEAGKKLEKKYRDN